MAWFFVVLGLVTLLLAGDFLVRAAVNLALRLGISALVVSLTCGRPLARQRQSC